MSNHVDFVVLGIVSVVALTGLLLMLSDFDVGSLGGRGRRYIEDAASAPDFQPLAGAAHVEKESSILQEINNRIK